MQDRTSIAIGLIGAGRLGASLGGALRRVGYDVRVVASVRIESARSLAAALGEEVRATPDPDEVLALCDLVFLTVPDAVIEPLSASVPWQVQHMVVHCSGAIGLEALGAVARVGGSPGCLHPLQSFPSRSPEHERFNGVFCGVEGGPTLGALLETIVRDLGSRPFRLEGVERALYHAAAVMASNHVVGLASTAARLGFGGAARRDWPGGPLPTSCRRCTKRFAARLCFCPHRPGRTGRRGDRRGSPPRAGCRRISSRSVSAVVGGVAQASPSP